MSNETPNRPDAFKERMAEARASGRPELANQSRGRPLNEAEDRFADALMTIYGDGAIGEQAVAAALVKHNVTRPSSGKVDWTPENFVSELQALNADLDAAYAEHGFGA